MKASPLKGKKWSTETKAKYYATRMANAAAKITTATEPATKDAIIYLQHAQTEITKQLRDGKLKRLDKAHLYALLALTALGG